MAWWVDLQNLLKATVVMVMSSCEWCICMYAWMYMYLSTAVREDQGDLTA